MLGFVSILAMEWSNPETLGPMGIGAKLLNAAFHSVMPRTAGFNSLDVGAFHDETMMVNFLLMFIGGGSAGTAGGIKVTTFLVLFAIVLSEVLGRRDAGLFQRRFGRAVERQALSVTVLAAIADVRRDHLYRIDQRAAAGRYPVRMHLRFLHRRPFDRHHRRPAAQRAGCDVPC